MGKQSPLLWAGIGLAAYLLLRGGFNSLAEKVSFGMPRLRMGQINFTGIDAELFLPITNGLSIDVPIEGFSGQLFYGRYALAQVHVPQAMTIEGNDTTTLRSEVQIRYSHLGQNVIALIENGDFLQSLRLQGVLRAGGINWPINQTISVL